MSRLEYYGRTLVAFDANNKDHRRYYAEFVENKTWGRCPVRFICPEDTSGDLISMIKNSMIQYYIDREFGGGRLAMERSQALTNSADVLYKRAGSMRKEAAALHIPRRA